MLKVIAMIAATAWSLSAQATPSLRIGLIVRGNSFSSSASIERGARLGAAEAKQTAALFGGDVLLFAEPAGTSPERAAERLLSSSKVQVLVGTGAEDADALSRFAEAHRLIFFNVASRAHRLRAACRRYTFHIEASDSMYAIAAKRVGSPSNANTVLWAPTLERYGASQINDRYRAKYNAAMDGGAWAGWVAVKIASEASLRARSANATAILPYLEAPSTNFDGHKGWPLSFRAADHQLRQPLYVVTQSSGARGGVRDVPELSTIAGGTTAASNPDQALDALMPKSAPGCAWRRQ